MAITLQNVKISDIEVREDKLRGPQFDTLQFKNLMASIQSIGLMQPISLLKDAKNPGKYILNDGQQRLAAHEKLGMESIDALVDDSDFDPDMLNIKQIQANLHRVDTKPAQYAQAMKRLLKHPKNRMKSHSEFLTDLGITESPQWLRNQLNLTNLIPEFQTLVDNGEVPVTIAYYVGTLDAADQPIFLEKAQTENVDNLIHEIEEFKREQKVVAKGESPETIDPLKSAKLRKLTELKSRVVDIENTITTNKEDKYAQGMYDMLMWVISLDPETVSAKDAVKKAAKAKAEEVIKRRREIMKAEKERIDAQINNQLKEEGLFN